MVGAGFNGEALVSPFDVSWVERYQEVFTFNDPVRTPPYQVSFYKHAILLVDGIVYIKGDNSNGQLYGVNEDFIKKRNFPNIGHISQVDIKPGMIAVLADNTVYAMSNQRSVTQILAESFTNYDDAFNSIPMPAGVFEYTVKQVIAGRGFGLALFITDSQRAVALFGRNPASKYDSSIYKEYGVSLLSCNGALLIAAFKGYFCMIKQDDYGSDIIVNFDIFSDTPPTRVRGFGVKDFRTFDASRNEYLLSVNYTVVQIVATLSARNTVYFRTPDSLIMFTDGAASVHPICEIVGCGNIADISYGETHGFITLNNGTVFGLDFKFGVMCSGEANYNMKQLPWSNIQRAIAGDSHSLFLFPNKTMLYCVYQQRNPEIIWMNLQNISNYDNPQIRLAAAGDSTTMLFVAQPIAIVQQFMPLWAMVLIIAIFPTTAILLCNFLLALYICISCKKKKKPNVLEVEFDNESSSVSSSLLEVRMSIPRLNFEDLTDLEQFAVGGSGNIIYRAKWRQEPAVFKEFKVSKKINRMEFENEVQIMSMMKHANIVSFYGSIIGQEHVGIIMEYCSHGSIAGLSACLQITNFRFYSKE